MEYKNVKMWMKVVPHSKTAEGRVLGIENSVVWRMAQERCQNYLYVSFKRLPDEYPECRLSLNYLDKKNADYFLCSDFEKYNKLKK